MSFHKKLGGRKNGRSPEKGCFNTITRSPSPQAATGKPTPPPSPLAGRGRSGTRQFRPPNLQAPKGLPTGMLTPHPSPQAPSQAPRVRPQAPRVRPQAPRISTQALTVEELPGTAPPNLPSRSGLVVLELALEKVDGWSPTSSSSSSFFSSARPCRGGPR